MKKCPQCGTSYSDVTLSFCLHDGTPLVVAPQADTPTVVLGDKSQVTHAVSPQPEKKRSNTALAVGLTVVGMLVLFGIIGLAAIAFLRSSRQASLQNVNSTPNTNYSTPYLTASPMPSPVRTPQSTPSSPPPALSSYPPTTRLRFTRGAYSTSFSGDINPRDTRSLVLACRRGQSLSANISGSACVNFQGGGASFSTIAAGGDNYLTIVSTCSTVARFTVTVSVI
jgi:hypothetical protein